MKHSAWLVHRNSKGHILLMKRSKHVNNAGLWGLPGGSVDGGESPANCARRECQEETGADPGPLLKMAMAHHAGGEKTSHFYRQNQPSKLKIKLNGEHDKYDYFDPKEAALLDLHGPAKAFLDKLNEKKALRFRTQLVHSNLFQNVIGENADGEIVARASICLGTRRLHDVNVSPKYRGLGYADELMKFVMSQPAYPITLTAKADMDSPLSTQRLVKFYSRYGFKPEAKSSKLAVKMCLEV